MELAGEFDLKKIESEIRLYMHDINIRDLISGSEKPGRIRFVEGPPTMNGVPHAGHIRGRVIKDVWYRYKTLQGFKVSFNAGWDTQGLPIELQAEKELGITGSKSEVIEKVGIERLVSECKNLVQRYNEKWVRVDGLLGMSFDQEKAYWTYKDEFIEREWQVLKSAIKNEILEEDHTVIAYCPSCQTSLSHAEVNQGYEEVTDPSMYYKVRLVGEDAFLIVWTTMPFTLVTDAMVGLNPNEDYHYARVRDETWIVGKTRAEEFFKEIRVEDHIIEKTVKGAAFEGKKYIHPLLNEIPALAQHAENKNYHVAVAEEFVDASTGSGLVHLSPANGEEDIAIARKRNVNIFNPIDDRVKFTVDAGKYQGLFVRDADKVIANDLKLKDALVRTSKIKHKYPLCWRSRHPIVWLARRGWFYKLDRLGDKAVMAAQKVRYFYEAPKNRFLGIIREKHPWCISRERIWGCPLPVWTCSDCGKKTWCFSRRDIIERAVELPDGEDFELHVPWIDNVVIRCDSCNSRNTRRDRYVLDTWHNSGSAPYSSLTDQEYSNEIPAPFFTEGIDQTRGWAYTLLIENVILNNAATSPYDSFLFQGHVLDEAGNKMSKSRGNILDGEELLTKYPVDLVRFYFIWKASPIESLNFDTSELMSRPYQVASTLYHLHLYYNQYARYDNFDPATTIQWSKNNEILTAADAWILSKLQRVIMDMTRLNDECRFHESARAADDYIINMLSQVYLPITRAELWDETDGNMDRRHAIYSVLYNVLHTLDILIHPFCPHVSEYLYQSTSDRDQPILLEEWPQPQESLINDSVEESFDLMRECVSISSAARMRGGLKRRWPISEAIICLEGTGKEALERVSGLLMAQMNVERYTIHELRCHEGLEQVLEMKEKGLPIRPLVDLERKKIGPKVKHLMGPLMKMYQETDPEEFVCSLRDASQYTFRLEEDVVLDKEDFTVSFDAADGFALSRRGKITVIIPTKRDREMMSRGLLRDVARRIQALRKEKGYNPTDVLEVASILGLDEESRIMLQEKSSEMAFLVRVKRIEFADVCDSYKDEDVDGKRIQIGIK